MGIYDDDDNDWDDYEEMNEEEIEQLKIENEILKLRFEAEFGGEIEFVNMEMHPKLANEFLKQFLNYQTKIANADDISIYEFIGKPILEKSENMTEVDCNEALDALMQLLSVHNIAIHYNDEYSIKTKYDFVVNDIMQEKVKNIVDQDVKFDFNYEDYYPNDKLEVMSVVEQFIAHLIERDFEGLESLLTEHWELPHGKCITKLQLRDRLEHIAAAYLHYDNLEAEVDVHIQNSNFAEVSGNIKYEAFLEDDQKLSFDGGISLHLFKSLEDNLWKLYKGTIPGMNL